MSAIVGVAGTSHSPMLGMEPERMWKRRAQDDRDNPGLLDRTGEVRSYDELVVMAGGRYDAELAGDVWDEKFARAQAAITRLSAGIIELAPDMHSLGDLLIADRDRERGR